MSKVKSKAIFTGEALAFLKEVSPKVKSLAGEADTLEVRAEQLFSDTPGKKGTTAKEKLYLFAKLINLGEGEPLFLEKKFGHVVVRENMSSKSELDSILNEAGLKDLKRVYERAKEFILQKGKVGVAPERPAVQKGKPEHAQHFRGPRSFRGKPHGNNNGLGNGFFDPEEEYERYKRANPKAEEKWRDYSRQREEELRKHLESFKVEAPRVWAETHPGEPYPPRDPGWQWVPHEHKWDYFAAGHNPFYDDARWFGREGAEGPSASARRAAGEEAPPPEVDSPQKERCKKILAEHGISVSDKASFRRWALEHHTNKGGNLGVFQEVSGCWTILTKGGGKRKTRKQKRKGKKTRRV